MSQGRAQSGSVPGKCRKTRGRAKKQMRTVPRRVLLLNGVLPSIVAHFSWIQTQITYLTWWQELIKKLLKSSSEKQKKSLYWSQPHFPFATQFQRLKQTIFYQHCNSQWAISVKFLINLELTEWGDRFLLVQTATLGSFWEQCSFGSYFFLLEKQGCPGIVPDCARTLGFRKKSTYTKKRLEFYYLSLWAPKFFCHPAFYILWHLSSFVLAVSGIKSASRLAILRICFLTFCSRVCQISFSCS